MCVDTYALGVSKETYYSVKRDLLHVLSCDLIADPTPLRAFVSRFRAPLFNFKIQGSSAVSPERGVVLTDLQSSIDCQ